MTTFTEQIREELFERLDGAPLKIAKCIYDRLAPKTTKLSGRDYGDLTLITAFQDSFFIEIEINSAIYENLQAFYISVFKGLKFSYSDTKGTLVKLFQFKPNKKGLAFLTQLLDFILSKDAPCNSGLVLPLR